MQLSQLKQKQLTPQARFATLAHINQIKLVHYIVKHEAVLPSKKDDCYPILSDVGNDQFSIHTKDKGGNIIFKTLDSFFVEPGKSFQSNFKNQSRQRTKIFLRKSAILNDTDITDNDDPIEKRYHKMMSYF